MTEPHSRAFWARCPNPACGTYWPLFYYPCRLADAPAAADVRCPKCSAFHAPEKTPPVLQNNGVLMEQK